MTPARQDELALARDPRLVLLDQGGAGLAGLVFGEAQAALLAGADWRELRIGAVVQFLGGADELRGRFGCRVLAAGGDYFAIQAPLAQLAGDGAGLADRLIDHPALFAVAIDRPTAPAALGPAASAPAALAPAASPPSTQLAAPRESVRLPLANEPTGLGVLLGVIDTVLDHVHPAFLDAQGRCRLAWLWDVNGPTAEGSAVPVGRLYVAEELRTPDFKVGQWELHAEAASADGLDQIWVTHGTIVASLAAGHAPDQAFLGVAHGAALAFAGAGNETTSRIGNATDLLAALDHVLRQPTPVVANLSTADTLGPHDGSLLGELLLDELLLRPGRTAVVCAGNFGRALKSASRFGGYRHDHAVEQAIEGRASFVLRYDDQPLMPDTAEIWLDALGPVLVEIRATVDNAGGLSMQVRSDGVPQTMALPPVGGRDSGGHVVAVLVPAGAHGGRWCLSLFLVPAPGGRQGFFPSSTWQIMFHGADGRLHAWVDRNNMNGGGWYAPTARADWLGDTVGSPGSARRVVTVGAVDAAGVLLASGSGRGPGLGGAAKPDLVARGAALRGATPGVATPWGDVGQGTSLATPLVAGTAALLLERWGDQAPHATWYDIRQALRRGAVLPGGGSGLERGWDPGYGFGVLDSGLALDPKPPRVDLWIARTPGDDGAEPLVREFPWDSPDIAVAEAEGGALAVTVTVRHRGQVPAGDILVALFWGPQGAAGWPRDWRGTGWRVEGIAIPTAPIARLDPGASASVSFRLDAATRPLAGMLMATVDCPDDRLRDEATPTDSNNLAVRSLPPAAPGPQATIVLRGTRHVDGLWLRLVAGSGRPCVGGIPITALPWRSAAVHETTGRRPRPQLGEAGEDPALACAIELHDAERIALRTDVEGAAALLVDAGEARIEASGPTLWLPRLRVAFGVDLKLRLAVADSTSATAAIAFSVFSDGRRMGGGRVDLAPASSG